MAVRGLAILGRLLQLADLVTQGQKLVRISAFLERDRPSLLAMIDLIKSLSQLC